MRRYCHGEDNVCHLGVGKYNGFLKAYGLDDNQPYDYRQLNSMEALGLFPPVHMLQVTAETPMESLSWIPEWKLNRIRLDTENEWYLIEACPPLISMNKNFYSKGELIQATRTLVGKGCNIDHYRSMMLDAEFVEIDDAQYARVEELRIPREGYPDDIFYYGVAECLVRVHKQAGKQYGLNLNKMLLATPPEIYSVSIETRCKRGTKRVTNGYACLGMNFVGLAFLRRKKALPGIPLTSITHVEGQQCSPQSHGLQFQGEQKMEKKQEGTDTSEPRSTPKLELAISDLRRINRDLLEEVQTKDAKIKALKGEIEAKEDRIQKVELSNQQIEKRANDAQSRLEELRTAHKGLVEKASDLRADNTRLTTQRDLMKNEQNTTDLALEDLRKEVEDWQNKHHDAAHENLKLTKQMTQRNNEIVDLKKKLEAARAAAQKARRVGRILVKI